MSEVPLYLRRKGLAQLDHPISAHTLDLLNQKSLVFFQNLSRQVMRFSFAQATFGRSSGGHEIQGYLAQKKQRPPRTLQ